MKYINAEKLKVLLSELKKDHEHCGGFHEGVVYFHEGVVSAVDEIMEEITVLQQEQDMGEVSDWYHTFNELYYYRMLYNAAFFNLLPNDDALCQWRCTDFPHHRYDMCVGDSYIEIRKKR